MLKISRFCLIVVLTIVFVIYIEPMFKKIFYEKKTDPSINYSSVLKGFVIADYNENAGKKFYDLNNNFYSRIEYQKLLPMIYYRDLSIWKSLPQKIDGIDINYKELVKYKQILRIKSHEFDSPEINLYPMYESDSLFSKIENPDSMFTIKKSIKFINANSNKTDLNLSLKFTKALQDNGFKFPSKQIFGNPVPKKPFDEGYFIEDSSGRLFHVKMKNNNPFVADTKIKLKNKIKYIKIQENELKEYYGVLVTNKNEFFLITYNNYELIKLPLEIDNIKGMYFVLLSDILKNVVKIKNNNQISCYAFDKNYKLIDSYSMFAPGFDEKAKKISNIFFPLTISLVSSDTRYVDFDLNFSIYGLFTSIPLLIFFFLFLRLKNFKIRDHIFDCLLIFFTGISGFFAFLAVGGFKNMKCTIKA
ncbi:MAG: DUF4857 domain-containing protein [Desulforegulaceae bacterium]|nr:DUF4857 domain-containing protein [Desulforegulaceae bacterium]